MVAQRYPKYYVGSPQNYLKGERKSYEVIAASHFKYKKIQEPTKKRLKVLKNCS